MKNAESYAKQVFERIKSHYGLSKYYEYYPELEFDNEVHWLAGEFRDDYCGIVMYPLSCVNEEEIVRTLVHEYQHYLQDQVLFEQYKDEYDYYDNPFEIEAYEIEERDYKLFL